MRRELFTTAEAARLLDVPPFVVEYLHRLGWVDDTGTRHYLGSYDGPRRPRWDALELMRAKRDRMIGFV